MILNNSFTFERWQSWLEQKAGELQTTLAFAECKSGGEPTSKPGCSFRLCTEFALGQFDVWVTGEADYSVMEARSKEFTCHRWGMLLNDASFEITFEEFRACVIGAHRARLT